MFSQTNVSTLRLDMNTMNSVVSLLCFSMLRSIHALISGLEAEAVGKVKGIRGREIGIERNVREKRGEQEHIC